MIYIIAGVRSVIWLFLFLTAFAPLCSGIDAAEPSGRGIIVPFEAYLESASLVLCSRYTQAEAVFDRFIASHPDEPAGYLLKAASIRYAAMDYEDGARDRETEELLKKAETLAGKRMKSGGDDPWVGYIYHSARSLLGAKAASGGSLLKGLALGRSGAHGLMKLAESHPECADAFLGAGSYRFWKSMSSGPVRNLPLVGDERERGIDEVKTSIERGRLAGPLANTVLLEMLIPYDAEEAAGLGGRLVAEYPACRLFAWQYGEALKRLERFDEAREVFERLAGMYESDTADDGSGALRCWWKLAVLAYDTGRTAECRMYSEKVIKCGLVPSVKKRQTARINGAARMFREIVDGGKGKGPGR